MQYEEVGKLIRGVGGLYEIALQAGETPLSGQRITARAKGNFRHEGIKPLVGDAVRISFDDSILRRDDDGKLCSSADGGGIVIEEILPRQNALIRPPMANLDYLFITFAAAHPAPSLETVDKLISIAEYNTIEPVIVIGKSDVAPNEAEDLKKTYNGAGFQAFSLSAEQGNGVAELREFLGLHMKGKTAAFDFIRVMELQCTGSTITRVGEHLLAFRGKLVVNRFEIIVLPDNLAADFDIAPHVDMVRNALDSDGILPYGVADIVSSACNGVY